MEPRAALPWRRCIHLAALLVHLSLPEAGASCRILRCNSDFVAATLDLGSSGGGGGFSYCGALRSYSVCTRRTARACRGDLAYHSAVQGIEDLLIQHRCPPPGPTARPRPLPPPATLARDGCLPEGPPDFLHCGVFGDPHIRTFNDDFHTCAVQGAWPLVDNEYLYIQATSSPSRGGAHATALTKVTVIFKAWPPCVDQLVYEAQLDDVPAAFIDGSTRRGQRRSLSVRTRSPGVHAEIRAAHIGAVVVVRQSGRALGLSVRAPRHVVEAFGPEQDLQLCLWGCPPSQRVDTLRPPPPHRAAPAGARLHCAALLPARDVYFRACVFDAVTGGDANASAAAAVGALQDARLAIPGARRLHLLPASSTAAGSRRAHLHLLLLLLGMLGTNPVLVNGVWCV